jgi:hypothetical protein
MAAMSAEKASATAAAEKSLAFAVKTVTVMKQLNARLFLIWGGMTGLTVNS